MQSTFEKLDGGIFKKYMETNSPHRRHLYGDCLICLK